ncbi:MAG: tRNA pseudouridine(13) synthase TruD [Candidatus Heimdallarchaeota archaeon]
MGLYYPQTKSSIGIERFSTSTRGIGGKIRRRLEDFIVEELIPYGGGFRRVNELNMNRDEKGLFTHLVIRKEGIDTPETAHMIAQKLGISVDDIGYAGNKDKRAIAIQRMSVWKVSSRDLRRKLSKLKKIQILAVYPARYGVKLGDLWGNQFRIRIQNIKIPKDQIFERIEHIKEEIRVVGVPNFFGPQRFGERFISHLVGKALLMGQIKDAIMLYLSRTSQNEPAQIRAIREKICEEQDFRKSLEQIPKKFQYERRILRFLSRRPNDFKGALSVFPRRILSLFIHAFQSWLFNKYLSERMKCFDSWQNPLPGDLVQIKEKIEYITENNVEMYQDLVKKGNIYVMGPLIGYKSQVPRETPGEIFNKILQAESIHSKIFKQNDRRITSLGSLRRISCFPHKLKAQILVLPQEEVTVDLTFCLEKGSYATIVLREFMKE